MTERENRAGRLHICSLLSHNARRLPHGGVGRRLEIVFAEFGHRAVAFEIVAQVAWGFGAGDFEALDFFLQLEGSVEQRLRSGRASREVEIHPDKTGDAFEDVVALLE